MKMMKKITSSVCTLGLLATSFSISYADVGNNTEVNQTNQLLSIEEQQKIWDEIDKRTDAEGLSIDEKNPNQKAVGTYPTRKGAILVTNDLIQTSLVGHAGLVYNANTTIESYSKIVPGIKQDGVYTYSNTWNTRFNRVYGMSVLKTSVTQDSDATNWALSQKGKPYNIDFGNIETTSKYYCSQLVYKAYKEKTGKNLNYGGGIVYPMDLVNTSNTTQIYKK